VIAQSHTVFFNAMLGSESSWFQERTFKLPAGVKINQV
jgi:hypothetical protein